MKPILTSVCAALLLSGCQPSPSEKLYNTAVQAEQQPGGDSNYMTVEAYRQVIRTDPNSSWAQKAQRRIDVIQQNINAQNAIWEARRTRREIQYQNLLPK